MKQTIKADQNYKQYLCTLGLWLLTAILGVLSALAARAMVIRNYLRFFPTEAWAASVGKGGLSLLNILVSFTLAFFVIAVIIGGFEYHHRRGGTQKSWRLIAQTLAVELALLLLPLFI